MNKVHNFGLRIPVQNASYDPIVPLLLIKEDGTIAEQAPNAKEWPDHCRSIGLCVERLQAESALVRKTADELEGLVGDALDYMTHDYPCEGCPCNCGMSDVAARINRFLFPSSDDTTGDAK